MSEYPWNEKNNTLHGSANFTIALTNYFSKMNIQIDLLTWDKTIQILIPFKIMK